MKELRLVADHLSDQSGWCDWENLTERASKYNENDLERGLNRDGKPIIDSCCGKFKEKKTFKETNLAQVLSINCFQCVKIGSSAFTN